MKIRPFTKTKVVEPLGNGLVKLHHHQTIRLSQSYNSAEANYGSEITVSDSPSEIRRGFKRLEEMVESCLVAKVAEQQTLLCELAKKKNG